MKSDKLIWMMIAKKFSNEIGEEEMHLLNEILKKNPELNRQSEIIAMLKQLPPIEDQHDIPHVYYRICRKISMGD